MSCDTTEAKGLTDAHRLPAIWGSVWVPYDTAWVTSVEDLIFCRRRWHNLCEDGRREDNDPDVSSNTKHDDPGR